MPKNEPPLKQPSTPDKEEIEKAKYFEAELMEEAVRNHEDDPLRAAILSWSAIEECFLPRLIEFTARKLDFMPPNDFQKSGALHLIRYYFLLSHDEETFKLLEAARTTRNDLVHKTYKGGSLSELAKKARLSAKQNFLAADSLVSRLTGEKPVPVLTLYSRGWNDSNTAWRRHIASIRKEYE